MHAEWESSLPKARLPGLDPPLVGPGSTWEWGSRDSEVGFPEGWPEACVKLPRPELVRGPFPTMVGQGEREGWMILRQRQSCTFVGGHEVLSLVFAVVEATGEDQVIIVTLEEESVRRATGQEGAPFREGTDTLLPLGSREHHIPESLPPMFWSCVVGTKSDLRDRELALLGLDGGCPPQLPEVPEHPETLF